LGVALQEIMTDPSYKEQFVVFTCPHIGNVGINPGAMMHRHSAQAATGSKRQEDGH
jgi:carbamoylphosphate synthase small subunit